MKSFNLEEYLKNPNRELITRDGQKARIICANKKDERYPVVALVQDKNSNCEKTHHYTIGGKWIIEDDNSEDLFFAPIKKDGWTNLYDLCGKTTCGFVYESEKAAKMEIDQSKLYVTTIKIEWEE